MEKTKDADSTPLARGWTSKANLHSSSPSKGFSSAILACLCYAACSTALTLANKRIFSEHKFNYPWTLLSVQSFLVMTLLAGIQLIRRRSVLNLVLLREMLVPCCSFTMYIYTNSRALRHVSLPILSVLKSMAPMGIALTERVIFGERITVGTACAMGLIIVGNVVTVLNDLEFTRGGYTWAFCNVFVNIIYVVSLRWCLSDKFTPLEKTIHSNFIAMFIMMCLSIITGELSGFLEEVATVSMSFKAIYLLSCMLSAGIGFSIFWVVQTSSGSTLSFVGACNKFSVVILGGLLFQANVSLLGWISVCFGVMAGIVFAISKARDKRAAALEEAQGGSVVGSQSTVLDMDGDNPDDENKRVSKPLL